MDSKFISKANKIILAALGVVALILIVVFSIKGAEKKVLLKNELNKNHKMIESEYSFKMYTCEEYIEAQNKAEEKNDDLFRISDEDYQKLHFSMWDISSLTSEWYDAYYAKKIVYGRYHVKTPQDVCNYILTAISSNPKLETIYMGLDPYELYNNYYTSVYYDSEILTFEEYIENNLFPLFKDNPNVKFRIFLPVKSLSDWGKEEDKEIVGIFKNWYTNLMYLRLYPNVKTVYMGNEEWLISNNDCFEEDGTMTDEIDKLVYLCMYENNDYVITPPEIDGTLKTIVAMVHNERNVEYYYKGLKNKEIVLSCDSVFKVTPQVELSLVGCIRNLTGIDCNLADETNSISSNDLEKIFVIEHGLDEYLENLNPDDFLESIKSEIKAYREKYPNSEFLLLTPYKPGIYGGGDETPKSGDYKLSEYVKVIRYISETEGIPILDLYKESGITFENSSTYLLDGIHPNYNTNLYIAKLIAEKLLAK